MIRRTIIWRTIFCLIILSDQAFAGQAGRIGIIFGEIVNIEEQLYRAVRDAIYSSISETEAWSLMSETELGTEIAKQGASFLEECLSSFECLGLFGKKAGLQKVVLINIRSLGGVVVVNMNLIRTSDSSVEYASSINVDDLPEEMQNLRNRLPRESIEEAASETVGLPEETLPKEAIVAWASIDEEPEADISASMNMEERKRFYTKWWFWTAIGGIAAVGLTALLIELGETQGKQESTPTVVIPIE